MKQIYVTGTVAIAIASFGLPLKAEGKIGFSGSLSLDHRFEWRFDSDIPGADRDNYSVKYIYKGTYGFTPNFRVGTQLRYQSVADTGLSDNHFETLGLFVRELYFAFDIGPTTTRIGKIDPAFAVGHGKAPGFYGDHFTDRVELSEKIGAETSFALGQSETAPVLTASVFLADTSVLIDSIGEERGQRRESDGGLTNTGEIDSFALSLDGEAGDLTYNLSANHLEADDGVLSDQNTYSAAAIYKMNAGANPLRLFGEITYADNYLGGMNDATLISAGATLGLGEFDVNFSGGYIDEDNVSDSYFYSSGVDYHLAKATKVSFDIGRFSERGDEFSLVAVRFKHVFNWR